ncbi:MAG: hypothetical protein K940chlam9_01050 [Chlamydiae bacterium]|nr:hypothetical protein [Chlamydiota bacterium]
MHRMRRVFFLLSFVLFIPLQGFAWWDVGHMLTVEVARSQLDPAVVAKIEKIVGQFEKDFPRCSTFTTASCFPDDITSMGLSGFKVWHGVLSPYDPDGILSEREKEVINTLVSTNNLHSAITQAQKTLKNPHASGWEQAFMLCFLLHCVGDIHQPLHCIHLYSDAFPSGDMAGHRYRLKGSGFKNIHVLWDSILGLGSARLDRPLNPEDEEWICSFAKEILDSYPPESFPQLEDLDTTHWSGESYHIAVAYVYDGIEPDSTPSEEYTLRGQKIALGQIALAGYRLAILLNELYTE